tara:strand:+ start:17 stop:517 length:501 start_codon:yes stop_codon:yes gene_type:complete
MASQLRVDKILPVDGAPTSGGGGIVQMVMTSSINSGSQFSTGSGSFVDVTGYNCTITPKFSTSKILITSNPIMLLNNGSGNSQRVALKLLRGSTSIFEQEDFASHQVDGASAVYIDYLGMALYHQHLDSPGTTSAVTYKIQIRQHAGGGTTYVQANSSMCLMEVSA